MAAAAAAAAAASGDAASSAAGGGSSEEQKARAPGLVDKQGEPYILISKLMEVMTSFGEGMASEHVVDMAREAKPDRQGRVSKDGFRSMLIH